MSGQRSVAWLAALLGTAAWGQLSEKPESWLQAQGQVMADARPGDVIAAAQAANLALRAAAAAGTPRKEAAGLANALPRLMQAQNMNLAWRVVTRLLAVAEGRAPGEWLEVAAAYDLALDRAALAPGTRVHVRLTPWYALPVELKGEYRVRLAALDAEGREVASAAETLPKVMAAQEITLAAEGLKEGRYRLRYVLSEGETELAACERPFLVDGALRGRLAALRADLRRARTRGPAGAREAAALAGAESKAAEMEMWLEGGPLGETGWRHPFVEAMGAKRLPAMGAAEPDEEGWRQAERFAKALAEGRDPFAGEKGDWRLGRQAPEGALTPYRLFAPGGAAEAKRPLVVLLHPFLASEASWGGALSGGALAGLAEKYGALVLCPANPLAFADPTPERAKALDELVDEVAEAFGADPARIYLAGHGTSAVEALYYALGRAPRYAGVGAVAGAPPRLFDMKQAAETPALFAYSEADEVAPVAEMRKWAAYFESRMKRGKALKLEKAGHVEAMREALPRLFEFFFSPPPVSPAARG